MMLRLVLLGGFLVATNGFETDCGSHPTKPCKIFSYDDLKNIEENGLQKHYALMNDIYAPTDPPDQFTPIGRNQNNGTVPLKFKKTFQGNGYTIHNLYIDYRWSDDLIAPMFGRLLGAVGLFARLGLGSVVCNLTLKNPKVIGSQCAGALAGSIFGAKVDNVVIDNPSVEGETAGGLLGEAMGSSKISRCHVLRGQVVGSKDEGIHNRLEESVGGLVGLSQSLIMDSSAEDVNVSSGTSACGGLVGTLYSRYAARGQVENSFATGNVSFCKIGGGLVGASYSSHLKNSYSVVTFKGITENSGAFIGLHHWSYQWRREMTTRSKYLHSYGGLNNFAVAENIGVPAKNVNCMNAILDDTDTEYDYDKNQNISNYCFMNGPAVGVPSGPEIFTTVESPTYFLNATNEPMAQWDKTKWLLEEGKYPSLLNTFGYCKTTTCLKRKAKKLKRSLKDIKLWLQEHAPTNTDSSVSVSYSVEGLKTAKDLVKKSRPLTIAQIDYVRDIIDIGAPEEINEYGFFPTGRLRWNYLRYMSISEHKELELMFKSVQEEVGELLTDCCVLVRE